MKKIILSLLLISNFTFAEVNPNLADINATEHSTNNFFPATSSETTDLVGESDLSKDEYVRGDYYNVNLGERTLTQEVDETGSINITDANGKTVLLEDKSNEVSDTYRSQINNLLFSKGSNGNYTALIKEDIKTREFNLKFNSLSDDQKREYINLTTKTERATYLESNHNVPQETIDALLTTKEANLANTKLEKINELEVQGHNQKNREEMFLKGLNSSSKGPNVSRMMTTEPQNPIRFPNGELATDTNVTNFYSQNYSFKPYNNSRTKLGESNANKLIEAFNQVDDIEAEARSHLESTEINCFISRDLIPAYYCPIAGQENVLFPDFIHGAVNPSEAKFYDVHEALNKCNDNCEVQQECKEMEIIPETEKTFGFLNGTTLYPTIEQVDGIYELEVDDRVQANNITFTLKITPSGSFTGTAEEFDNYLRKNAPVPLKVKYSLFSKPTDTNILPEMIVNRAHLTLLQSEIQITLPIQRQVDRYVLKFFKPYLYPSISYSYQKAKEIEFMSKIETITIEDIKVNYTNNNVFFCPVRQAVTDASQCAGEILHVTAGTQVYDICLDNKHKIGEDIITGGFFVENSCTSSCFQKKECLPTYKHYASFSNLDLFKSTVGCVDENTNLGCRDEYCERLFADSTVEPVEEVIIQNEDEKVYTIQNFLTTNVPRPKIDMVGEQMATTEEDMNILFQKEMKDSAYKNMIDNQTYDRIKYKIGEVSPSQVAHLASTLGGGSVIKGLLKPSSDTFDTGVNYNVYAVMKLEQVFRAKYGQFYKPSVDEFPQTIVNAEEEPVILKDDVYLILNRDTWNLFRRTDFSKIKVSQPYVLCPGENDATPINPNHQELSQTQINDGCYIMDKITWVNMANYASTKYVRYNEDQKDLVQFSPAEASPKIYSGTFDSDQEIKEYLLANTLESNLEITPGAFIRLQDTLNNGVSLKRVYDMTKSYVPAERGIIGNVQLYLLYSQDELTFRDIVDNHLKDENLIYDHINRTNSKSNIVDDGEINDNLKPFLLGTPNKTTLSIDLKPYVEEEGQRIFKFIFLFNEKYTEDPFAGN